MLATLSRHAQAGEQQTQLVLRFWIGRVGGFRALQHALSLFQVSRLEVQHPEASSALEC